MKKFKIIIIFLILASLTFVSYVIYAKATGNNLFLSKITGPVQDVKENDKIVAKVNDEPIYLSNVALYYFSSEYAYEMQKQFGGEALSQVLTEPDPVKSLDDIINPKLLYQYAKSKGYKADQNYLNSLIKSQREAFYSLLEGNVDPNADPSSKVLFQEFSKASQDMVNESGLSKEDFFKKNYLPELEKSAVVHSMMSNVINEIQVQSPTDEEIEEFLKQYKGSISLLKLEYATKEEALKMKDELLKEKDPDSKMLPLMSNKEKPVESFPFHDVNDLPVWLRDIPKELDNLTVPFITVVEDSGKFYLVDVLVYNKLDIPTRGFAIDVLMSKKRAEAKENFQEDLIKKLRASEKIEIIDIESVKNLRSKNP